MAIKKWKLLLTIPEMKQLASDCTVPALKKYLNKRVLLCDSGNITAELEISEVPKSALGLNTDISSVVITKRNAEVEYKKYMAGEMSREEEIVYEQSQGISFS